MGPADRPRPNTTVVPPDTSRISDSAARWRGPSMSDDRLLDFYYPGDNDPAGVIEGVAAAEFVETLSVLAPQVRHGLDVIKDRGMDCRHASVAWERALRAHGLHARMVGGEGTDDDVFTSDYRLVALDRRSGYRRADDDIVHRHYWLEVGPDRLIFDPTAHQFDDKGGVSLDRYTIEGTPLRPGRITG
jgi:hypothetical protein